TETHTDTDTDTDTDTLTHRHRHRHRHRHTHTHTHRRHTGAPGLLVILDTSVGMVIKPTNTPSSLLWGFHGDCANWRGDEVIPWGMCVCVCVCVCDREREIEREGG